MSTPKLWFDGVTREDVVFLSNLEELGSRTWRRIYAQFESCADLLKAPTKSLAECKLTEKQIGAIKRTRDIGKIMETLERKKIKLLTIDDPDYPPLLKGIYDPPMWLYYYGDMRALHNLTITVVGARKISPYGAIAIETIFVNSICQQLTTVSGLAFGVDKAIHQRSVESGGKTVAVLAGGLDKISPASHIDLARQIVATGGAIISEYPPFVTPDKVKFPIRNRIIAGLSPVTVVVEAGMPSGTMITAKSALDNNREVWAIPADITRSTGRGCNILIRDGATPLIEKLQIEERYNLSTKQIRQLDKHTSKILDLLEDGAKTVDELGGLSGLEIGQLLEQLTVLELSGDVYQKEINLYEKT